MKISRTEGTMISNLCRKIYNFTSDSNYNDLLLKKLYNYSNINDLLKVITNRFF